MKHLTRESISQLITHRAYFFRRNHSLEFFLFQTIVKNFTASVENIFEFENQRIKSVIAWHI